mmetsp:Transcript_22937/g.58385  ORF Transcript_22937/g.58385 Transcript_22937/m.58385 type:complete len:209 (-) Transcript_22937:80-706(-)
MRGCARSVKPSARSWAGMLLARARAWRLSAQEGAMRGTVGGRTRTLVSALVGQAATAHVSQSATPARHLSTTPRRLSFSKAAATRSLSLSCLLTACSEACVPGVMATSTLKRGGRERSSLTRMLSPISVAMLQCGIVGVKVKLTSPRSSSTVISWRCATLSCSSVFGCSGSLMSRMRSKISRLSTWSRWSGSASMARSSAERCSLPAS